MSYKDYYFYSSKKLAEESRIPVTCMASSTEVFKAMAREMADTIKDHNAKGLRTVFIVPVGPVGQYPYFVDIVNTEEISLKSCWFFNMDEYMQDQNHWVDIDDRLSFRGFMRDNVYSRIKAGLNVPEAQRFFPDPKNPSRITDKLEELGGADICFGGIGINGHVAFNEAQPELSVEEFSSLTTRVLKITDETRTANSIGDLNGAIEDMPHYAATIGMKEILSSKKIRLGVFRTWHRAVVRRACCGSVEAAFPVSIIQNHPDAHIYINDVASEPALS